MATSKPSKVDSVTFPMRPSKAERYQIEREKDAQFAKIPQDLITEYFDLEDEKKGIEVWAEKELDYIHKSKKEKLHGNSKEIETNYQKLKSISGLDGFALLHRLKRGGIK
jgi:hypothetical protein